MRKTIVWFVISAAFIGPGTVTAATNAGANYGTALLWTILFSVLACILLQEGSARINIVADLSLGQAILKHFTRGNAGKTVALLLSLAVVLGCAAYEAGNVLGAVSGIALTSGINSKIATTTIILLAAVLLYTNKFSLITSILASIIGIMGLTLLVVALTLDLDYTAVLKGFTIPKIPVGAELLTIGLIGTTVVPYNLFLGSRIAKSQELTTMRRGLILSVILGGLITISLILIGSTVVGAFSFKAVAEALSQAAGPWAIYFFAFGLFAAGLTSTITAPWAASIAMTTTLTSNNKNRLFTLTWVIVLLTGLIFGVSEVKPIPVIILAQAVNGILLPFLAIAILLILNNKKIMQNHTNGLLANIALLLVVWVTSILGLLNFLKAFYTAIGSTNEIEPKSLLILVGISLMLVLSLGARIMINSKNG